MWFLGPELGFWLVVALIGGCVVFSMDMMSKAQRRRETRQTCEACQKSKHGTCRLHY